MPNQPRSERLANTDERVAHDIWQVFQRAYQIEAQLIGVADFPPLKRTASEVAMSSNHFYGCLIGQELLAVAEVTALDEELHIHSFVVDPNYFRCGNGARLFGYVLAAHAFETAYVDTAQLNAPAISLFSKFGFREQKRWLNKDGIPCVRLSMSE